MHINPDERSEPSRTDDRGTSSRRRRILEHVRGRSEPVKEGELAARIAANDPDSTADSTEDVSDEQVRDVEIALRHVDLPKAEAAGLVTWDESEGVVEPAADADLTETEARQLFADGWNDATAVSRHERRQAALTVLRDVEGEVSLSDLAAEVADHESDTDVAPSASDVDDAEAALHHRHLPRLADAGLVEYDSTEGTVRYSGPDGPER